MVQVESGGEVPIRRSRGYAPLPIRLPFSAVPTLAVGGELKNTFCLASGHDAFMSQHIGDMGSLETRTAFERSARQFAGFYRIDPVQVAADAHPDYTTRRWADDVSGRPVRLVHHHHAHVAAVMVEHGVPAGERVIGIAFDGTGYGLDGTIWGGEVLVAGYDRFARTLHLRQVPLPGGDAAVRKPYRTALAHLWSAGIDWDSAIPAVGAAAEDERAVLLRQLERGVSCVPTSSMGRLFDAVSSLLGIRHEATYEAQAAIELEWCASAYRGDAPVYEFSFSDGEFDAAPVLQGIVRDLRSGVAVGAIAAGFHAGVAGLIADAAQRQRHDTGIGRVALDRGRLPEHAPRRPGPPRARCAGFPGPHAPVRAPQRRRAGTGAGRRRRLPPRGTGRGMMDVMESSVTPSLDEGTAGNLAVASLSLARRFAAGATMWCVAPQWPSHGRHVAVEFVHPVIVGKRALPAVSVAADDAAAAIRLAARPGDVLLVLSTADDPCAVDLLARAGRVGTDQSVDRGGPPPGRPPRRSRRVARSDGPGPVVAVGRHGAPLPPAVGADPRGLRAPGAPGGRSPTLRECVRDVLRRGPCGRGQRGARRLSRRGDL